jgi:toxin FitB
VIVLDTNVVSEALNGAPDARVNDWLDRQEPETLFLTVTSLAELLTGVEYLPEGKRKKGLSENMSALIARLFEDRILAFDKNSAPIYAAIVAGAKRRGKTIAVADGQIAAIAALHGFSVATRDLTPFEAAGTVVINPWLER